MTVLHERLFCVDMGTTRSRVWLVEGERLWAYAAADFGVRDVARGMPISVLRQKLNNLLEETGQLALHAGIPALPAKGIGAGMITSPQGLLEIPHIPAPAGDAELARNVRAYELNESLNLTLFLVPGVKTVASRCSAIEAAIASDLMRGEESLCVGLLATTQLMRESAVLHLGSHWKWIFIDSSSRIAGTRTSLTGELIHAAQSQTLLASGLPQDRPSVLNTEWLELGSQEYLRSGLTRALFCIRLLEQSRTGSPEERLAFLYGAFLEAEIEAMRKTEPLRNLKSVCIVGAPALVTAWKTRLEQEGTNVNVIEETQRDMAYLAGLRRVFSLAGERSKD